MNKKEFFLVGLAVVLVGIYVVYFTDWFRPKVMRIEHSERSLREAWNGSQRVDPGGRQLLGNVTFALHRNYQITSVKVVPLADYRTNKYAHPLWELGSKSGSRPVNGFTYGMPVAGMAPARPDLEPDPLEAGVDYRIIVEAGLVRGEHDFKIGGGAAVGR
jgi:hypothetical protein